MRAPMDPVAPDRIGVLSGSQFFASALCDGPGECFVVDVELRVGPVEIPEGLE